MKFRNIDCGITNTRITNKKLISEDFSYYGISHDEKGNPSYITKSIGINYWGLIMIQKKDNEAFEKLFDKYGHIDLSKEDVNELYKELSLNVWGTTLYNKWMEI